MGKFYGLLAIIGVALAGLFAPRTAKGNTTDSSGDINPVPLLPLGSSPKGIRNNNPFNIEYRSTIDWIGQIGTDGRFAVFDTAENGIRAGMINIRTKFNRDGANTVRALLNILSPHTENPTEAYIQFVSRAINVSPDQPLVYEQVIIPLSKAIVFFENGENPYPNSLFDSAYRRT